jgi:hypothetical protein
MQRRLRWIIIEGGEASTRAAVMNNICINSTTAHTPACWYQHPLLHLSHPHPPRLTQSNPGSISP